jgi:short-subunit dehydrogenase
MKKSLLVLGATSAIAKATTHCFASHGYNLYLAGRDKEELSRLASDLSIRHGVIVKIGTFDARNFQAHQSFLENAVKEMEGLQGALLAFGTMDNIEKANEDFNAAREIIDANFTGACSLLHHLANYFASQRSGFIVAISSVAGDRGRQSNYIYGAAKGGLSLYLQGLRNRLYQDNVNVITVKPGMVDTPMTYGKPGVLASF